MNTATTENHKNPFPGLRPFAEDEEYLFFGRESQVDAMVDKLAATRFLAVIGTSGSGKSSLVNCGLRPALHSGLMARAGTVWRMAQFRPGSDPMRAMAGALAEDGVLFHDHQGGGMTLGEIVDTTLRMSKLGLIDIYEQAQLAEDVNLLIVVDQFEELFRYRQFGAGQQQNVYGISEEATAFVNLLLAAKEQTRYPIYVVLTMRSDFLGDCTQFTGLAEAINAGQYLVPRMIRDEHRAAIVGPVGVGGSEISPVLLTRLVNDVGDNPDQLSILQHALNRTWNQWERSGHSGPLDLPHYEAIGTMAHALDHHAESAYAELTTTRQQQICDKLFKALTDKATDPRGVRRPTTLGTLCALAGATQTEVTDVINVFRQPSRSFLMPPAKETLEPATVIDISHESLMRVWERLKTWADEEAQSAQIYTRLAETAVLHRQGKAGLWNDPDLQVALDWKEKTQPNKEWAQRYDPGFEEAMAFLQASEKKRADDEATRQRQQDAEIERARRELQQAQALAEAQRQFAEAERQKTEEQQQRLVQQARAATRLRRLLVAFAVVALLAIASTVFAFSAYKKAEAASREAKHQKSIAIKAKENAESAANEAEQQRRIAFAASNQAKDQESIAIKEKENAVKAARLAEEQKQIAFAATKEANDQKIIAVKEKENAENQRAEALLAKNLADEQRLKAEQSERHGRRLNYVANMNLATQAQMADNQRRVYELLNSYLDVDTSKEDDLRSFYWYHLWHNNHNQLATLQGHKNSVSSVAFSPDGKMLASADRDGTVKLWDMSTRQELATLQHKNSVYSVAFSSDGKMLASADRDKTVKLWDISTRQELATLHHKDFVYSIAFSPDGKTLASATSNAVTLWDISTRQELATLHHKDFVYSVAFSPDGKTLASAGFDKTVKLWDIGTRQQLATLQHKESVKSVVFSPDGKTLASANSYVVTLWDISTWQEPVTLTGHKSYVNSVAFSPDGKTLASAGVDWTAKLWDINTRQELVTLRGHSSYVDSIAFSPDGKTLASASSDNTVQLWDTRMPQELTALKGHSGQVNSIALSPDGKTLASAGADKTIQLWKFQNTGKWEQFKTLTGHESYVLSVAFSPDGKTLASSAAFGTVKLWDTGTWQESVTLNSAAGFYSDSGHSGHSIAFSSDGKRLAAGDSPNLTLWRLQSTGNWEELFTFKGKTNSVVSVAFSPEGNTIAAVIDFKIVKLWDISSGQELRTLNYENEVFSVAFSPDGKTLASAGADNTIHLWNTSTWHELGVLSGHFRRVVSMAFSPDGKTLATASWDQTVKLWDTRTLQELATLTGHLNRVFSVAFSIDGKKLASAGEDGTVRLWIAATDQEVAAQRDK
jgi:WD40 repeat protein